MVACYKRENQAPSVSKPTMTACAMYLFIALPTYCRDRTLSRHSRF